MDTPYVFDIHRSSRSDGEGIRTTVFFKGCPLDCFWCHNPEGKSALPQLGFFEDKCIGCGACKKVCERTDECLSCFKCAEVCPESARRVWGKKYTPEELFEIIAADKLYYNLSGGGVTFSGGECMLYPEYLSEVTKLCREGGISVAVDTAGYVPYAHFETVLPYTNVFLYDVKCLDRDLHIEGTGVDNGLILENLDRLLRDGGQITVRVPVIPDFNEGEECRRIAKYCAQRGLPVEFLPYHEFGKDKKKALINIK